MVVGGDVVGCLWGIGCLRALWMWGGFGWWMLWRLVVRVMMDVVRIGHLRFGDRMEELMLLDVGAIGFGVGLGVGLDFGMFGMVVSDAEF